MTSIDDVENLRAVLAAHKAGIDEANSEAMATQAILFGLLVDLKRAGMNDVIRDAIELAASSFISSSEITRSPQSTRSLEIVDDIKAKLHL